MSEEQRWDAGAKSDPIADIRSGMEASERWARAEGARVAAAHARYGKIVAVAKERQDSGAAKAAIDAVPEAERAGNVWLADEQGVLAGEYGPIMVPRTIAIGLGADLRKVDGFPGEVAFVTTTTDRQ